MKLTFKYTDNLTKHLLEIEKYKASLEHISLPIKSKEQLAYNSKLKSTHFSTKIEGNALSFEQVKNLMLGKHSGNTIKAEREIQNYWNALTFLEKSKKPKRQIDLDFILELQKIIIKDNDKAGLRGPTPPGVIFAVYDIKTGAPEYIPPEAKDILPLLNDFLIWFNTLDYPCPIKSALIHYAIATIHPFNDGNGRTARALSTYLLMLEDYDFNGFNSVEEYYMSSIDEYYSSLQMGLPPLFYNGRNNPPKLEIWLEYFCKIMALNAEKIYHMAKDISQKAQSDSFGGLSERDISLIKFVKENNITIIKRSVLAEHFNVTPRAITDWAKEWIKKGIIIPTSGEKRITSYKLSDKYTKLKLSELNLI